MPHVLYCVTWGLGDSYYALAYADPPLSTVAVDAVARVNGWLLSFVTVCNEKMGRPYKKCRSSISNAVETCK